MCYLSCHLSDKKSSVQPATDIVPCLRGRQWRKESELFAKWVKGRMQAIREKALISEEKRRTALSCNDAEALQSLLSDRLVFVHSSGTEDGKQQLLQKISTGAIRYLDIAFSQQQAQVLSGEQHVMVSGIMRARIMVADAERSVRSRYLAVWSVEVDGCLRLVAHQGTALPLD